MSLGRVCHLAVGRAGRMGVVPKGCHDRGRTGIYDAEIACGSVSGRGITVNGDGFVGFCLGEKFDEETGSLPLGEGVVALGQVVEYPFDIFRVIDMESVVEH